MNSIFPLYTIFDLTILCIEYMKQNGKKCVPKHFHNISTTFINKGVNKRWFDCFTEEDYTEYNNLLDMFFKNDVKEWSQSGKLLKI